MFHNKKFLFVESIFFILVVIFAFKIGWRDVSANFNSLTNLGIGHTKIDVSSDGSIIGFIPSSIDLSANISNNNGTSITNQSATRNSWIDIYESGGKFVAVSDSNGDYIHYFDGGTWNPLNVGSGTYPSGPFTSISINDYGNTVIATKGNGWFDYVVGGGSWSNNYNGSFWTDSALSSDGNVVLMSSSNNGVYVNTNGNPASISNVISGNFTKVAMNDSASQMLILSSTGDVLYSTNGFSWNNLPNISGVSGMDVANSGAIVVSQGSGEIRYTTDLGLSWITLDSRSLNWADVKINDEGTKVYAVIANDYPQTIDLIQGCKNSGAVNYNPSANIDNGSCYFTPGCTNSGAVNYNPSADYDDGSCDYAPTISSISSDKSNGTYDAGEVIDIDITFSEPVTSSGDVTITLETGDTDQTCQLSLSNQQTGTCNYTVQAGDVTSDLNVSSVSGSIYDANNNYMSDFTIPSNLADNKDIVIITTIPGCTDNTAVNYNPSANVDNGSCYFTPGCTDNTAVNYNPSADYDDGSCQYAPPTLVNINSNTVNGTYGTGSLIDIILTFSEEVYSVLGLTINLDSGGICETGSFSNVIEIICNYTVAGGQNSSDLTVSSVIGTIYNNINTTNESLTPATNLADNKDIVVTTVPGCTDNTAVNYNPSADYDNGSCQYSSENFAPIISNPLPSGVQAQDTIAVTLQVTTNENSTCRYGTIEDIEYDAIPDTFSTTGGTTHTQSITGLSANTSYTYYVRCNDGSLSSLEDTLISFSIPANTEQQSSSSGSGGTDIDVNAKCTVSDTTVKVGDNVGVVVDVKINNNSRSKNYDFNWIQELKGKDQTTSISFDKEGKYTPKARIRSQFVERTISCDTITVSNDSTNTDDEVDENIVTKTTKTVSEAVTKTFNSIINLYNQYLNTVQTDPTNTSKLNDLINQIREQFSLLEMTRLNIETTVTFTKDLEFGMQDTEVKLLQQFLNNRGYIVAETGPGSKGIETEMFGFATRAALARFQRDNNISPALGFFGSVTRSLVNSLLN